MEAYEQGLQAGWAQEREWRQRAETAQVEHLVPRYGPCGKNSTPRTAAGDRVLLPENHVSALRHGPAPSPGTVTELGTTYTADPHHDHLPDPCHPRQTG